MSRKGVIVAMVATVAVFVFGAATVVVVVQLKHPRDESAYLEYLRLYGRGEQTGTTEADFTDAPITLPSIPALMAEGDRACEWLSHQGYALWRTDQSHRMATLSARYRASRPDVEPPWPGDPQRDSVVTAAWHYLCPASWELHKPHRASTRAQPD